MTRGIFGGTRDLPPVAELARKTRDIMRPVSPKKGTIMDIEKTNEARFTAKDAANIAVFVGVATFSFIAAVKLAGYMTEKTVDAVANTFLRTSKKNKTPDVTSVTETA
jgi:hypothetical protein